MEHVQEFTREQINEKWKSYDFNKDCIAPINGVIYNRYLEILNSGELSQRERELLEESYAELVFCLEDKRKFFGLGKEQQNTIVGLMEDVKYFLIRNKMLAVEQS